MRWYDSELSMHVSYADSQLTAYPVHSHEFVELVIIAAGGGIQIVDGMEYAVSAGDVYVMQGTQSHGFKELYDSFQWNVAFDPDTALTDHAALRHIPGFIALFTLEPYRRGAEEFRNRLKLADAALVQSLAMIRRLHGEQEEKRPGWRVMCRSLLEELLVFLSREYDGIRVTAPADLQLRTIGAVIALMEERKDEELTLSVLAGHSHMSVNNFLRVFRAITGTSPIDYLNGLRLEAARRLLRDSRMNVGEIARSCGFHDSNYFARAFRKRAGVSPREFRAQPLAEGNERRRF